MFFCRLVVIGLLLGAWSMAHAVSPTCPSPETKLSWPAVNPVWEMCWLPPNLSVGPDGSGMELRKVYFKGHLVFVRAHAPMLFAEYRNGAGGNCYRDWKDDTTPVLSDVAVQNKLGISVTPPAAITSCDRSKDPTASYGICPYQLSGFPQAGVATCALGVAIEDGSDHVVLTTQYRASWYMYSSRWTFWSDGHIEPSFGFGNNNGTYNSVTHWHHNYWRLEFGIDGGHNTVSTNGLDATVEFSDLRNATGFNGGPTTWEVRNPATGNGYQLIPGAADYLVPTNESGRNFHTVDFMATQQHANEYGDSASNNLGDCTMNKNALVNAESLVDTNVAVYYHVSVRDSTANNWPPGCGGSGPACIAQDSMECKSTGATLVAFGPWVSAVPAATVAPGDVNVVMTQGSQKTKTFDITNSGAVDSILNYTIDFASVSCATPDAVSWLSATPTSGFVTQGATAPITARINATTLTPGQYSAFVCVHSDDPANAVVSLPVGVTSLDPSDFIFVDDFEG